MSANVDKLNKTPRKKNSSQSHGLAPDHNPIELDIHNNAALEEQKQLPIKIIFTSTATVKNFDDNKNATDQHNHENHRQSVRNYTKN